MPFFTWIYEMLEGYHKTTKNIDPSIGLEQQIERRLTVIQSQRAKFQCNQMGFIDEETDHIQEYFMKEVTEQASNPVKVLKTLNRLFQEVRSKVLVSYFLNTIIKKKDYDFQNFITIVFNITRVQEPQSQAIFLSNLFADTLSDGTHL
jgi:hypothetical protein